VSTEIFEFVQVLENFIREMSEPIVVEVQYLKVRQFFESVFIQQLNFIVAQVQPFEIPKTSEIFTSNALDLLVFN
jgi:hypothetical protein